MRKLAVVIALAAPLAALAAPQPPGPPADAEARHEWMQKRMRIARTLGLAEALDLSEAEALKLRETLARLDARREPVARQAREAMGQVKKAAQGDAAAQKGLDDALMRLREARVQMRALRDETFTTVARDLSPERKAKAALFLMHFQKRMGGMGMMKERRELRFRGPRGPGGANWGGPEGSGPRFGAGEGPPEPPIAGLIEIEAEDDEL